MSLKENSFLMSDCEELDFEEDDVNNSAKKCLDTLDKEQDVEEGEILDSDDEDCSRKRVCSHFKHGECRFGDKCPYFHITDKGLYRMLDPTPSCKFQIANPNENSNMNNSISYNCKQDEKELTDWDRALIEAKKLVKQYDSKVNRKPCPPLVITIESDDEQFAKKSMSKVKPRRYKSPSPKVLPRNSSHTVSSQRSPENKNDMHRETKWHDPWRRSPISRTKSVTNFYKTDKKQMRASSSSLESRSESPPRRKTKNRDKRISRRSSSSSSSWASVHRSKPKASKGITKMLSLKQKKKFSPDCVNKVDRNLNPNENFKKDFPLSKFTSVHEEKKISPTVDIILNEKSNACIEKEFLSSRTVSGHKAKKSSPVVEKKLDKHLKHNIVKESLASASVISEKKSKKHFSMVENKIDKHLEENTDYKSKKQCSVIENKLNKNFKTKESMKKEFSSNRQSNVVDQWTPKKIRPPTPVLQSCSDMSTSPLTDSSLSDLFDPDKKTNELKKTCQQEASRSRLSLPRKLNQADVYGPIYPQKAQLLTPSTSKAKSDVTQSNKLVTTVKLPKVNSVKSISTDLTRKSKVVTFESKRMKKNFSALENELLKFHRQFDFSEASSSKNSQQKVIKPKVNKTPKEDNMIQKITENKKIPKETSVKKYRKLSDKDILLIQIEAVNALIEKRKKMYASSRK